MVGQTKVRDFWLVLGGLEPRETHHWFCSPLVLHWFSGILSLSLAIFELTWHPMLGIAFPFHFTYSDSTWSQILYSLPNLHNLVNFFLDCLRKVSKDAQLVFCLWGLKCLFCGITDKQEWQNSGGPTLSENRSKAKDNMKQNIFSRLSFLKQWHYDCGSGYLRDLGTENIYITKFLQSILDPAYSLLYGSQ